MKKNVEMVRKMGGLTVTQRTSDGYFNITSVLKQWNKQSGMKKEITKYLNLEQTQSLSNQIVKEEKLDTQVAAYEEPTHSHSGTWVHPILFVDFCMWINISFRYRALKFLSDHLIEYRNLSGDSYNRMAIASENGVVLLNLHLTNQEIKEKVERFQKKLARYVRFYVFTDNVNINFIPDKDLWITWEECTPEQLKLRDDIHIVISQCMEDEMPLLEMDTLVKAIKFLHSSK